MSGDGNEYKDIEEVIRQAKLAGLIVYRSNAKTLLVDLDTEESRRQYAVVLPILAKTHGAKEDDRWISRGGNAHRVVKLDKPAGILTRLGLQAMLGSDGVKEALSLQRAQLGISEPSILFRPTTL
jgi:hypothetical protein